VQHQNKKDENERLGAVPPEEIEAIINGDVEKLVSLADRIGKGLARDLTTSQVRNFFGIVRRIESTVEEARRKAAGTETFRLPDDAYRQLMLLKPKMAYQSRRTGWGVKKLSEILTPAIDHVGRDAGRFKNFVDFFEAILAYHKAYGGRESSGRGN